MSDLSKAARTALEALEMTADKFQVQRNAITSLRQALAQPEQEPVTLLPDGSAFSVMSFPLPNSHWLYAEREYRDGEHEPIELGKPILTHKLRSAIVSAVRYAIRGATNCGKEMDFDPDALVQNAVYALCGPYTRHVDAVNMSQERVDETAKDRHEPVAWISEGGDVSRSKRYFEEMGFRNLRPLYTAPPKKEWVGYTKEDRERIVPMLVQSLINHDEKTMAGLLNAILIDIEQQLKEKNGG